VEFGFDATSGGVAARPGLALVEALSPLDADTAHLLAALAHQLRTPLTSVLGYLELLLDGSMDPLTAEQERVLHTVAASMTRLAAYVDDLEPRSRVGPG